MNLRGLVVMGVLVLDLSWVAYGNLAFPVVHKFKGRHRSLSAFKAHDDRRRGRFLSAVDLSLGGNGLPSETGLYYTKIQIGSPPKDYSVQVDTGSDTALNAPSVPRNILMKFYAYWFRLEGDKKSYIDPLLKYSLLHNCYITDRVNTMTQRPPILQNQFIGIEIFANPLTTIRSLIATFKSPAYIV